MAGYSGTPLAKKLGIKDEHRVGLFHAPDGFEDVLAPLPEGAVLQREAEGMQDVMVLFCKDRATLEAGLAARRAQMDGPAGLWIGWPKKSSGVETDLTQFVVMEDVMEAFPELVDNKVCAIDETWSGLRFVIRKEHR